VGLVHAAVQELERFRHLVVGLEHHRDGEQHHEREVDERVHEAGRAVAEQRLHEHTGAEVVQAAANPFR
jgi:hypothetical protein